MCGKGIEVKIRLSDVENFKTSVKIGDKFWYQSELGIQRVFVIEKYQNLVKVKSTFSSSAIPIKTMTYTEMLIQKRGNHEQKQFKK